jgi:hypothetical protein
MSKLKEAFLHLLFGKTPKYTSNMIQLISFVEPTTKARTKIYYTTIRTVFLEVQYISKNLYTFKFFSKIHFRF